MTSHTATSKACSLYRRLRGGDRDLWRSKRRQRARLKKGERRTLPGFGSSDYDGHTWTSLLLGDDCEEGFRRFKPQLSLKTSLPLQTLADWRVRRRRSPLRSTLELFALRDKALLDRARTNPYELLRFGEESDSSPDELDSPADGFKNSLEEHDNDDFDSPAEEPDNSGKMAGEILFLHPPPPSRPDSLNLSEARRSGTEFLKSPSSRAPLRVANPDELTPSMSRSASLSRRPSLRQSAKRFSGSRLKALSSPKERSYPSLEPVFTPCRCHSPMREIERRWRIPSIPLSCPFARFSSNPAQLAFEPDLYNPPLTPLWLTDRRDNPLPPRPPPSAADFLKQPTDVLVHTLPLPLSPPPPPPPAAEFLPQPGDLFGHTPPRQPRQPRPQTPDGKSSSRLYNPYSSQANTTLKFYAPYRKVEGHPSFDGPLLHWEDLGFALDNNSSNWPYAPPRKTDPHPDWLSSNQQLNTDAQGNFQRRCILPSDALKAQLYLSSAKKACDSWLERQNRNDRPRGCGTAFGSALGSLRYSSAHFEPQFSKSPSPVTRNPWAALHDLKSLAELGSAPSSAASETSRQRCRHVLDLESNLADDLLHLSSLEFRQPRFLSRNSPFPSPSERWYLTEEPDVEEDVQPNSSSSHLQTRTPLLPLLSTRLDNRPLEDFLTDLHSQHQELLNQSDVLRPLPSGSPSSRASRAPGDSAAFSALSRRDFASASLALAGFGPSALYAQASFAERWHRHRRFLMRDLGSWRRRLGLAKSLRQKEARLSAVLK